MGVQTEQFIGVRQRHMRIPMKAQSLGPSCEGAGASVVKRLEEVLNGQAN